MGTVWIPRSSPGVGFGHPLQLMNATAEPRPASLAAPFCFILSTIFFLFENNVWWVNCFLYNQYSILKKNSNSTERVSDQEKSHSLSFIIKLGVGFPGCLKHTQVYR